MVLSFFRKGDAGIDHIANRMSTMIGDARHSFDLATATVLAGADPEVAGKDIRETDHRINQAEQELRGELVVHVSVQGTDDIGTVLAYTLLLKKIERIGDQAKNILDLADEGVSLAGEPDVDEYIEARRVISAMFGEVAELLIDGDEERIAEFRERADSLLHDQEAKVREFLHSAEPGSFAVPRAILHRYWKRIVANLAGILTSVVEPIQYIDYYDGGDTDITGD